MARVEVFVSLKPALLDAQGKVVQGALQNLGYNEIDQVRIGKFIEMTVADGPDLAKRVDAMCRKLLANPVIEDYRFEVKQ
jgi:phosphoribosylformylglycinamidine synthase